MSKWLDGLQSTQTLLVKGSHDAMSYQDDDRDGPPARPPERDAYADRDQDERYRAPVAIPRKPGQAGCSKGCLFGLVGCGCLSVVMVIALGFGFWKFGTWYSQVESTDPAVIRQTAQEMADFEPPAGFKPVLRMNLTVTKTVAYESDDGESQLTLQQVDKGAASNENGFWMNFDKGFRVEIEKEGRGVRKRRLDPAKSDVREIKIRGQNAKVNFVDAKDPSDGTEFKQITGTFQGKGGPVTFELQMLKEEYKEEDVIKFLEGIK